ncbi:hypothetical protein B0H13DRAFT_2362612 [Mycena leptocephala]|nr:hypothetical protein B0H13DRAFT_2362612 [Mycena leptocephala]
MAPFNLTPTEIATLMHPDNHPGRLLADELERLGPCTTAPPVLLKTSRYDDEIDAIIRGLDLTTLESSTPPRLPLNSPRPPSNPRPLIHTIHAHHGKHSAMTQLSLQNWPRREWFEAGAHVVFYGGEVGSFENWADAQRSITGHGLAIHAGFPSLQDAEAALVYARTKGWTADSSPLHLHLPHLSSPPATTKTTPSIAVPSAHDDELQDDEHPDDELQGLIPSFAGWLLLAWFSVLYTSDRSFFRSPPRHPPYLPQLLSPAHRRLNQHRHRLVLACPSMTKKQTKKPTQDEILDRAHRRHGNIVNATAGVPKKKVPPPTPVTRLGFASHPLSEDDDGGEEEDEDSEGWDADTEREDKRALLNSTGHPDHVPQPGQQPYMRDGRRYWF